jgi:hypothetical protein
MSLTGRLCIASIVIAAGALALAYGLDGQGQWSPVFVALGLLWWTGQRRGERRVAAFGLLGFVVGAVIGFWMNLGGGRLLLSTVAALAAWDLGDFALRLQDVDNDEDARALEHHHLWRLAVVSGIGLLLGGLALTIRVDLRFGVVSALGLIAIFGLSRLVRFLRRESDA